MFKSKKKIFFILFSTLILSFFALFALAKLEIQYPDIGGGLPEEKTNFTDYVKYIFNFSMIVAGVLAFGTLVFSGFKILTSPDQPSVISDARTKIISAFIGIVILLSSYLILTTLNPSLSIITVPDIETFSGVILTDDKGKQHYLSSDNMSLGFTSVSAKFLSPPIELTAIYDQNDDKKENTGADTTTGFSGNSIRFLWNRSGVYLYPKTGFQGYPRYINSSVPSLSSYDFDNKSQSIKFIDSKNMSYGAVLFTDNDFRGTCGYSSGDIENLAGTSANFTESMNPIGFNVSSFVLLNKTGAQTGEVTFYDAIDCDGCKVKISDISQFRYFYGLDVQETIKEFTCSDGTKKPTDKNILSFEINGNFGVVLNTQPRLGGKCQLFVKPPGTTCVSTLKGEYVYGATPDGDRVRSLMIIPLAQ